MAGRDGARMPPEIEATLASHHAFGVPQNCVAEPEAKLRFDRFRGEPRNSDLAVVVDDANGTYLMAVEAKADEPFGESVEEALAAALDRKDLNPRSNGITRIEQLLTALMPPNEGGLPSAKSLRYQLFTAAAGALCEAERRGLTRAVLLVHEFVTAKADDEKHRKNAADLDAFVARLSEGAIGGIAPGGLYGPILVSGRPLLESSRDLFVGKAVRKLR